MLLILPCLSFYAWLRCSLPVPVILAIGWQGAIFNLLVKCTSGKCSLLRMLLTKCALPWLSWLWLPKGLWRTRKATTAPLPRNRWLCCKMKQSACLSWRRIWWPWLAVMRELRPSYSRSIWVSCASRLPRSWRCWPRKRGLPCRAGLTSICSCGAMRQPCTGCW